jgi:hypothetical protein
VDIYEYGHWEDMRFVLDKIRTAPTVNAEGFTDVEYKVIDFTHAVIEVPPGQEITQADLDNVVAEFISGRNLSTETAEGYLMPPDD